MLRRPKLFLSYATPDRKKVLEVYNFLLANDFTDTWIDCKKILPGQDWDFEIKRNLQKADIVILFISHNSINRRGYVQREIKIVLKNLEEKLLDDIYLIPIKIDIDAEIPDLLSSKQWLDINSENAFDRLKESLITQVDKLGLETQNNTNSDFNTSNEIQIVESVIKESWDGIPGYEVEYRIPQFISVFYDDISEITKIVEAKFIYTLQEHRSFKLDQMPDLYNWMQDKFLRTSTFDASYSTIYISNKFISFHYTIHWYGAGAAHPNYNFLTFRTCWGIEKAW